VSSTKPASVRLVRAGKVRAIGASDLKTWRIAKSLTVSRLNGWASYTAVQQRYTYLRPVPAADFGPQIFIGDEPKDLASSTGTALVAYSVLLSGAYEKGIGTLPPQFAGAGVVAIEVKAQRTSEI
jgi:aryl-alcohol dehydrogenase-like predicted oxidoreductase